MSITIFDKLKGLPSDITPIFGQTASDITTTTAVSILAPSAATKALYITKIIMVNKTPAEAAIITVQDDESTPNVHFTVALSATPNGGHLELDFDPPMKVYTGAELDGIAAAALGDCRIFALGYEGTPPA